MKRLVFASILLMTTPACVNLFFAGEATCFNELPITDFDWSHADSQSGLRFTSETMVQLTRADGSTVDIEVGEASKVDDALECLRTRPLGFGRRSAVAVLPDGGVGPFRLTVTAVPGARFVGVAAGSATLTVSGGGNQDEFLEVEVRGAVSSDGAEATFSLDLPQMQVEIDPESGVPVRQTVNGTVEWQLELPSGEVVEEVRVLSIQSNCGGDGRCQYNLVYPPIECL